MLASTRQKKTKKPSGGDYYMSDTLLCFSQFVHLNFMTNLRNNYVNSHLEGKENEIQKGQVTCPRPHT